MFIRYVAQGWRVFAGMENMVAGRWKADGDMEEWKDNTYPRACAHALGPIGQKYERGDALHVEEPILAY